MNEVEEDEPASGRQPQPPQPPQPPREPHGREHPILIVGAGRTGLMAAVGVRQRGNGTPFLILERRTKRSLVVGGDQSDFVLSPMCMGILRDQIGLVLPEDGDDDDDDDDVDEGVARRGREPRGAALRRLIWSYLGISASPPDTDGGEEIDGSEPEGVLWCGADVVGYSTDPADGTVTARLRDGRTVLGSAILGMDPAGVAEGGTVLQPHPSSTSSSSSPWSSSSSLS